MFLHGLHLGELIPKFQAHKIEFGQLLSMTDSDLAEIGVAEVGARKKILNAVLEVHKKEWRMPENGLPFSRPIRCVVGATPWAGGEGGSGLPFSRPIRGVGWRERKRELRL